ncbi:MAG: sulfatase-like hydrolase/transferase [Planctomycetota bacterium]
MHLSDGPDAHPASLPTISRRGFLGGTLAAGASALLPGLAFGQSSGGRPNVVFFNIDDLNCRMGPYGDAFAITPNLDAFAKEALTFDNCQCQYPVCGPSRASFMTGLHCETTGNLHNADVLQDQMPGTVTLPECFKRGGYWTGRVGKLFNAHSDPRDAGWDAMPGAPSKLNANRVFAYQLTIAFERLHGPADTPDKREQLQKFIADNTPDSTQTPPGYGPSGMTDNEQNFGKMTQHVEQWIDGRADRPLFAAIGYGMTHVPFWAPDRFFDMYPVDAVPVTDPHWAGWDTRPNAAMSGRFRQFGFTQGQHDPELARKVGQAYYASMTYFDTLFGRVVDAIKDAGEWDNTIVIVSSDNGYHLGENGMWGKATLFEESARVPLIIRAPGVTQPGTRSAALVEMVDVYPTLCELCSLDQPHAMHGKTLRRVMTDPSQDIREAAYTVLIGSPERQRNHKNGRSIRTQQYRYTEWEASGTRELYDMAADPQQHHNLAESSDMASTVRAMSDLLSDTRAMASSTPA